MVTFVTSVAALIALLIVALTGPILQGAASIIEGGAVASEPAASIDPPQPSAYETDLVAIADAIMDVHDRQYNAPDRNGPGSFA